MNEDCKKPFVENVLIALESEKELWYDSGTTIQRKRENGSDENDDSGLVSNFRL